MLDILFSLAIVFGALVLLLIALILYIKTQYRRGGVKLIVLPLSKPKRSIYLALGTLLLIGSITIGITLHIVGNWINSSYLIDNSSDLASLIGGIMSGLVAYFWMQVFLPIELRDNGIIFFGSLVKWSRIRGYEWKYPRRLLLKFKPTYSNWRRKWMLEVPSSKRERVEQILSEKLSNQKNHETSQ